MCSDKKRHFRCFFDNGSGTLLVCDFLTSNYFDYCKLMHSLGIEFSYVLEIDDVSEEF